MGFTPSVPQNDHERALQNAGYRWFDTVDLNQRQSGNWNGNNDMLQLHQHSSHNTHLIVEGELTLADDNGDRIGKVSAYYGRRKQLKIQPYESYQGWTDEAEGCTFVEAHRLLSPATAERFESRGRIEWTGYDSDSARAQWFQTERNEKPHIDPVNVRGLYWYPES